MTNLDRRTPSSTNGCLAFSLRKMSARAESNDTSTHSLAEPLVNKKFRGQFLYSFTSWNCIYQYDASADYLIDCVRINKNLVLVVLVFVVLRYVGVVQLAFELKSAHLVAFLIGNHKRQKYLWQFEHFAKPI